MCLAVLSDDWFSFSLCSAVLSDGRSSVGLCSTVSGLFREVSGLSWFEFSNTIRSSVFSSIVR